MDRKKSGKIHLFKFIYFCWSSAIFTFRIVNTIYSFLQTHFQPILSNYTYLPSYKLGKNVQRIDMDFIWFKKKAKKIYSAKLIAHLPTNPCKTNKLIKRIVFFGRYDKVNKSICKYQMNILSGNTQPIIKKYLA